MSEVKPACYYKDSMPQSYRAMGPSPAVSGQQLKTLADEALLDGQLSEQEKAVFADIAMGPTAYNSADLDALPPQVQALFGRSPAAAQPAAAKAPAAADPAQQAAKPKAVPIANERLNDGKGLSAPRQRMLHEISRVVGSSAGDKIGPMTYNGQPVADRRNLFDGAAQMDSGTTCGMLPTSVLRRLGVQGDMSSDAVSGVEIEARRLGVWVDSTGSNQPKPGDIYTLRNPSAPDAQNKAGHVGLINKVDGDTWETADSGQGTQKKQAATLNERPMQRIDGHPNSPEVPSAAGDPIGPRRVGGWADLDKLHFLQTYQDMLHTQPPHRVLQTQGEKDRLKAYQAADGIDGIDGISKPEIKKLAELAMSDGELGELEQKVFKEIAHIKRDKGLDISDLPPKVQELIKAEWAAPADPNYKPIPLPSDKYTGKAVNTDPVHKNDPRQPKDYQRRPEFLKAMNQ